MWAVLAPHNRSLPWGLAFWQDKLSKRVWDPTWSNLGAKRAENDPKMEPQNDPKRDQNDIKILIDFWSDFGAILEAQGDPAPENGGMRGLAGLF